MMKKRRFVFITLLLFSFSLIGALTACSAGTSDVAVGELKYTLAEDGYTYTVTVPFWERSVVASGS